MPDDLVGTSNNRHGQHLDMNWGLPHIALVDGGSATAVSEK
jgi:hypothetical protein